jgi:streptogramin lyase
VWVKTDDGRVVRVDQRDNRVTAEIRTDTAADASHYCQGIGVADGKVWACSAGDRSTDLVEIDPVSVRITTRAKVDKVFDQLRLATSRNGLWVLSANGTRVTRVDPRSGTWSSSALGLRCLQLGADESLLVATCATESTLLVLDPDTGAVLSRVPLPEPRQVAPFHGEIWVDTAKGIMRLRRDLSVAAIYPSLTAGVSGDLLVQAGAVWVRTATGTIFRIDPETGDVREQIVPDADLTPGSMLVAYGSIWTTSGDDGILYRLSQAG